MHSGLPGLVEMVYNAPKTGHVVIVVDNATTAMTGTQENPSTGRKLDHSPATRVVIEDVARGIGIKNVAAFNPVKQSDEFMAYLKDCLSKNELSLIVLRQPCVLASGMLAKLKTAAAATANATAATAATAST
jgi:indolepyruvate ferredoxin oxidoreductase alpha subunit